MKIAICGDVHWSEKSSIVNSVSGLYTDRLNNLIKSINWFEEISEKMGCDKEVFLGDFMDKPFLTDKEISAIRELHWNSIKKVAIVGNHESSVSNLEYTSLQALESDNFTVIKKPMVDDGILYLPYCYKKVDLSQFGNVNIIFSHNDIANINYGSFVSKDGYDLGELEGMSNIVINGHIHNGGWVGKHTLNLGNLTGQNFSEDCSKYSHNIAIIDTETLKVDMIENPYAFNFYKSDLGKLSDLKKLNKNNLVLSIKCNENEQKELEEILLSNDIMCSRISYVSNNVCTEEENICITTCVDHYSKLCDFITGELGNSKEVMSELAIICGG